MPHFGSIFQKGNYRYLPAGIPAVGISCPILISLKISVNMINAQFCVLFKHFETKRLMQCFRYTVHYWYTAVIHVTCTILNIFSITECFWQDILGGVCWRIICPWLQTRSFWRYSEGNQRCRNTSLVSWSLSHDVTKPTKWVCAQWRLRSAWGKPRLIWVFAGRTLTLLVLSCPGSFLVVDYFIFSLVKCIWHHWFGRNC